MPQRLFYQDLITALDSDHRIAIGKPEVPGQVGCENIKWSDFLALLGSRRGQQDIASANTLTVDSSNQSIYITSISNELKLLNTDGFVDGDLLCIILNTGGRIKHNETPSGDNKPYLISGGNITVFDKTAFLFEAHDSTGDNVIDSWLEVGRSSSNEGDTTKVIFTVNVTAADVSGGTLMLTPSVDFGSGTVKLYDGKGNEFVLTNGVAASVQYESADLDGETEKNFTWVLEITDATAISVVGFINCNIIDFSNLVSLPHASLIVDLSYNKLSGEFTKDLIPETLYSLNIGGNPDIEVVDLSGHSSIYQCFLEALLTPASAMTNLQIVNFAGCSILADTEVVFGDSRLYFEHASNLREIDITGTAFIQGMQLLNMPLLTDVKGIETTNITYFEGESSGFNKSFLEKVMNSPLALTHIDLSSCNIYGTPIHAAKDTLTTFNVSSNNISGYYSSIENVSNSIIDCYISNNNLAGDYDFTSLLTMQELGIRGNPFTSINCSNLTNLISVRGFDSANAANQSFNFSGCTALIQGRSIFSGFFWFSGSGLSYLNCTNVNWSGIGGVVTFNSNNPTIIGLATCTKSNISFNYTGNGWNQASVDSIMADLLTSATTGSTLQIISGNTGNPSLSASYAGLIANGWSII